MFNQAVEVQINIKILLITEFFSEFDLNLTA